MMKREMGIKSAYGQLVLLVFLPISVLASVGAVLVFSETKRAIKGEQDALAQAAIVRYEPLVRPLLEKIASFGENNHAIDSKQIYANTALNELILTMDTGALSANIIPSHKASGIGDRITQPQQHVQRMAVLDKDGQVIASVGGTERWQSFDKSLTSIWRLTSQDTEGVIYGVRLEVDGADGQKESFWLVVDMDNEPLIIAYYRVLLALAITGLVTILLLLLILNIYSKRWIAPIYEMRLYLQGMTAEKLDRSSGMKAEGEFKVLQQELTRTMRRLKISFDELKKHSDETETDLQNALDEMEMQAISIRKAHDLAVSNSLAKSAFLANISHELRTPLNSIDGFINLLARRGDLDDKQAIYVQTIQKSSAHLLALINEVLDFSKMEAGKLVLECHELNLYDVVYEVADMLSPTAQEKNLRMAVLAYNDVPTMIRGDMLRLKQVLTNLLGNAIKFTEMGDVLIIVSLDEEKEDTHIRISIQDSGKGIDKGSEHELFESFSQGDLSITRRYGGTGLGLVISKQLVELMGGEIGFLDNHEHDIASRGTTFWFSIPINGNGVNEVTEETEDLSDIDNSWQDVADGEILVWLLHEPSRQALFASLVNTGVKVSVANSFAHLLQNLKNKDWQWVIADSFGQDGDVTALLRQIRLHYQGRLAIFGYEIGFDRKLLAQYHADVLREPLDRRQLHALLSNQTELLDHQKQRWQGVQVLIVDDHEPNLLVLEALLNEQGVQVIKAESGFEAIEIMTRTYLHDSQKIDLIFMDIQMPKMSGLEASTEIRALEKTHHKSPVPIIALTAHGMFDEAGLLRSGLSDYASKPMGQMTLIQLLQKWLSVSPKTDEVITHHHVSIATQHHGNDVVTQQILDWEKALTRSGGKPALASKLLGMLINDIENQKQSLESAWANRNRGALADIAHKIVGGARYTGTPRLEVAAEIFEQECRQALGLVSASDFVAMRPKYRSLIDALDELQAIDVVAYLSEQVGT